MRPLGAKVKRWLFGGITASCLSIGLIAFAHTKAGRPLLNALRGAPGCPVDLDGRSPEATEAFRQKQRARAEGADAPHSHEALGFVLGATTRAQVESWIERTGAACERVRQGSVFRCRKGQNAEDLHLQLDPQDRLVAIDRFRHFESAKVALAELESSEVALSTRVGPATHTVGPRTQHYLEAARFRRTASRYAYRSYTAVVSATNFGSRHIVVREQYQWWPSTS